MSASDRSTWRLERHVCGLCLGPLVSRRGDDDNAPRVYRCAACGLEGHGQVSAAGQRFPTICACASRIGTLNAGIRCVSSGAVPGDGRNLHVAREMATAVSSPAPPKAKPPAKPVKRAKPRRPDPQIQLFDEEQDHGA